MVDTITNDNGNARARRAVDDKESDTFHVEDGKGLTMSADEEFVASFPEKQKKKLLRKMDLHIIPCLISLYCMSLADLTSFGVSRVMGAKPRRSDVVHR